MPEAIAIIKLPLARMIGEETVGAHKQLDEFSRDCDRARNYTLRAWARWREDHEETWKPSTKVSKAGNEYEKNEPMPRYLDLRTWEPTTADDPDKRGAGSFLYRKLRQKFPNIGSNVASVLSQQVWAKLRSKVPWRPGLTARTVAQSVMTYENSIPTFRSGGIPIRHSCMQLAWEDGLRCKWTLWPRDGRRPMETDLRCTRLRASQKRQISLAIAAENGHRVADSYFKHHRGRWFLFLCIHIVHDSDKLDPSRALTITAADQDARLPFWVGLPSGEEYLFGHSARALDVEWSRLVLRRKTLRHRSKVGMGRGHGNGRFYRQLKTGGHRWHNVSGNFQRVISSDLRKLCNQHNCGRLVYHAPGERDKGNTWFGVRDIPFFWEDGGLKSWIKRLKNFGIEVKTKERVACREIEEVST